ncbi:ankyrin repeat-containing domain protein [Aspergillus multicolor]|uniref:ankyrin repeat-containing domain protein n=1 Tax=Aspergillus multicolor TaxID=41759 RepID=UPI003CCC8FDE
MNRLQAVVPWQHLPSPLDASIASQISAMLNVLMPEEFEGQHQALQTTQLKLELYLLSNALAMPDKNTASTEEISEHDRRLLETVRILHWHSLSHFKTFLASHEPTVGAIAEKLFASAIRLADTRVVRAMLQAGMDPNNPIHGKKGIIGMTPLASAADMKNDQGLELCELLISYGADINLKNGENSPLLYAIYKNNKAVIKVLCGSGATVSIDCLAAAATVADINLFDDLLGCCDNPNGLYRETVVVHWVSEVTATLLGAAAKSGRLEIIQRVLHACPGLVNQDQFSRHWHYASPLCIAIEYRCTDALQMLIDASVDTKIGLYCHSTLIEHALAKGDIIVCKILIDNGALIRSSVCYHDQETVKKVLSTYFSSTGIVHQLKIFKIETESDYSEAFKIMLEIAIEDGDHIVIAQLADAGAIASNLSIDNIKDVDTAKHLDKFEALRAILDISSGGILIKTLEQGKCDLAWWLIDRDVKLLDNTSYFVNKTPLIIAARKGNLEMVEGLISRGSRVTDRELVEAVHHIQNEGGNIDVLQRLLVNFRGSAPSAVALAGFGHRLDLLQLIFSTGADSTGVPTNPGRVYSWQRPGKLEDGHEVVYIQYTHSALEIVAAGGSRLALEAVMQSTSTDWDPTSAGRALALAIYYYGAELVDQLLQMRPNINERFKLSDGPTYTALQAAVEKQQVPLVRKLLDLDDIDINYPAKGVFGRTALQHAVACGNWELINLLLSRGADVNSPPARYAGATALQLAAIKGYLPLASELIQRGANVNARGAPDDGRTALEGAAEHGRIDMVHLLLEHGASIQGRFGSRQHYRAVCLARKNCHYATVRVLESFMEKLVPVQGEIVEESEDSEDSETSIDSDHVSESELED